jgi:hypothetical protein
MRVSGKVSRIFANPFEGRNGPVTLYSFKVEGNDKFFRLGEHAPQFRETDVVTFESDQKGKATNLEVTRAPAKEETTAPPAPARSTESARPAPESAGKVVNRDSYWADKEARDIEKDKKYTEVVEPRITYAAARHDAVTVVGLALQHDLLALGNANKSAKLGLILGYVDQVTARFAANSMRAHEIMAGVEPEQEDNDTPSPQANLDD